MSAPPAPAEARHPAATAAPDSEPRGRLAAAESACDAGDHDDDQGLQLPLLGLYADLEAGRGSVLLPDEFRLASAAVQLEILSGWQRGLCVARQQALRQLYIDLAQGAARDLAQQMDLFRTTCASLNIEVPADFIAPGIDA